MTPLLAGLVDDAGLFPPSFLPMEQALARHRAASSPMLSGRFLCQAKRLEELETVLDGPIEVHLIGDTGVTMPSDDRVSVRAVELRAGLVTDLPCYLEGIPPERLKGHGVFGKLRCGGAHIPSVEDVARYVKQCAAFAVPFKATAGLHAAVRGGESTNGVPHHGYLNLLVAVSRALAGGDVAEALSTTDAQALVDEAQQLSADQVVAVRWLFHSYGSCDTDRPVRDARELGLIA